MDVSFTWSIVRWSLRKTDHPGREGKSRTQGQRHVVVALVYDFDQPSPFAGSTTAGGMDTVAHYRGESRVFGASSPRGSSSFLVGRVLPGRMWPATTRRPRLRRWRRGRLRARSIGFVVGPWGHDKLLLRGLYGEIGLSSTKNAACLSGTSRVLVADLPPPPLAPPPGPPPRLFAPQRGRSRPSGGRTPEIGPAGATPAVRMPPEPAMEGQNSRELVANRPKPRSGPCHDLEGGNPGDGGGPPANCGTRPGNGPSGPDPGPDGPPGRTEGKTARGGASPRPRVCRYPPEPPRETQLDVTRTQKERGRWVPKPPATYPQEEERGALAGGCETLQMQHSSPYSIVCAPFCEG